MMPWIGRIVVIVLDGAGVGALPDAGSYGDADSNTLGHVAEAVSLRLPNLQRLGLGNIVAMRGVPPARKPLGAYGRMAEASAGKDSTIGHWELMGLVSAAAFPTYPEGFPDEIIEEFARRTGRGVIGNKAASGTEIIEELYEEHRRAGKWIVYTSADSVLQVAAHEEVIPPQELYEACRIATDILMPQGRILRVIARPFTGAKGNLKRTPGRRDYNMPPPGATTLDLVNESLLPVVTVGKIDSMFAGRGICETVRTTNNADTLDALRFEMELGRSGLVFANLVDFDMLYGHRNDAQGFARALVEFDEALPGLLARLGERELLIITADHGCDPTTASTDHSREYVPLIVYGGRVAAGTDLGTRESFADVGATVCDALGVKRPAFGSSFWPNIALERGTEAQRADRQRVDWLHRRDFLCGRAC